MIPIALSVSLHKQEGVYPDGRYQVLPDSGIHLNKGHIDSWNHDLPGFCITEIKEVMNHIPFFMFGDTISLNLRPR